MDAKIRNERLQHYREQLIQVNSEILQYLEEYEEENSHLQMLEDISEEGESLEAKEECNKKILELSEKLHYLAITQQKLEFQIETTENPVKFIRPKNKIPNKMLSEFVFLV